MHLRQNKTWRLRFSLTSLLVVLTAICWFFALNANVRNERRKVCEWLHSGNGYFDRYADAIIYDVSPQPEWKTESKTPLICQLFGDEPVKYIEITARVSEAEKARIAKLFPEAAVEANPDAGPLNFDGAEYVK